MTVGGVAHVVGAGDGMNQIELLVRRFENARVPLRLAYAPFARGVRSGEIVQMDVQRTPPPRIREEILLWPGAGAELFVSGIDADIRQLVLRVREPARRFVERRWDREQKRMVEVERWTTPDPRRFLVGMDESHLFVAQLTTRATTVADAHAGLRPKVLEQRPEARRQGEWFFVPVTPGELHVVQKAAKRFTHRKVAIGSQLAARGRPHVVDQLVRLQSRTAGERPLEFVRGKVRHPDHATIELAEWMRVFMNTEDRAVGATWVD